MKLDILRRRRGEGPECSRLETFEYIKVSELDTVATALSELNSRTELRDADGTPTERIGWSCSCLQKKCGACAMVINGRPALACDTFLKDCGERVRLEPLKKFPLVEDLIVDRGTIFDNLERLKVWIDSSETERQGKRKDRDNDIVYEASRCLQCGCCLEVCPNFYREGDFAGTAAAVPLTRLLTASVGSSKVEQAKIYRKNIFEGCGKSLACRDICPAGLDIDSLLSRSNAAALWGRL